MEPSLHALNEYLDESGAFDEIHAMLFNHGVEAVGLPSIDDWEKALARAGKWVGAEPSEFPMDYAQFSHYHSEVQKLPGRLDLPQPLSLRDVDEFFDEQGDRYRVNWVREHPKSAP